MPRPVVYRNGPTVTHTDSTSDVFTPPSTDEPTSLGDLTRDELYHLAQERDIEGRSAMSKDELIEALS